MSLIDGFKHLVFEDAKPKENQIPPIQDIPPTPKVELPKTVVTTQVDNDIEKTLDEALKAEKQKSNAFDYYDFKNMLTKLTDTITDERTRYQSANAMAFAMNITPETLINSAKKYFSIIQNEESTFKNILQEQFESTVANKENEKTLIDDQINEMNNQINELTVKIAEKQKEKLSVGNDIINNKANIEKAQNAFYSTYTNFLGKIQSDIEKISLYLGVTNG